VSGTAGGRGGGGRERERGMETSRGRRILAHDVLGAAEVLEEALKVLSYDTF